MVSKPYFPEFFYAFNHRGILKTVPSKQNFQLDLDAIEKGLSKKTKVLLVNSPNNPTGVVYQKEDYQKLGRLLKSYSKKNEQTIYLVSDEPYDIRQRTRIFSENLTLLRVARENL